MAARDFFILHGEKVAVGVVGTMCAYLVINAFTNEGIRPVGGAGGASAKSIKDDIQFIDSYRPKALAPILKPVPEYASRMKNDFGRTIPAAPLMSWTSAHPDLGPTTVVGRLSFAYIYELLPPVVTVKDAIGSVVVTVDLPPSQRDGERLSDSLEQKWTRKDTNSTVENHAEIVGAIIEQQTANGEWTPVNGGAMLPVEEFATGVTLPTLDYESYAFRARLVARASGFRFEGNGGGEVLVADGRWKDPETPVVENDLKQVVAEININKPATVAKFLRPSEVAGVAADGNDSTYLGPQNAPVKLRAQSAVKFQLLKLDPDPNNPADSTATVLLTKLMRGNGKEGWIEMQKFTVKKGMKLGDTRQIDVPIDERPDKVPVDLSTPFELVKIEKDVKRIFYWELKLVARKDGKPGKEFELRSKDKVTDTVTFKNGRTGELLVLTKLDRLTRPNNPDAMITPDLQTLDEKEAFEKDAGAFVQQELLPVAPIKHAPDAGPLQELLRKGDPLAKTDTDYYEMPDGRLFYYEPNNKKVMPNVWKPGVTPKPKVEAPKPAAPVEPKGPAVPSDMPTSDAPMMPPAGSPPPGMFPPGTVPPGAAPAAPKTR